MKLIKCAQFAKLFLFLLTCSQLARMARFQTLCGLPQQQQQQQQRGQQNNSENSTLVELIINLKLCNLIVASCISNSRCKGRNIGGREV